MNADEKTTRELSDLVRSARALVTELAEEGVDHYASADGARSEATRAFGSGEPSAVGRTGVRSEPQAPEGGAQRAPARGTLAGGERSRRDSPSAVEQIGLMTEERLFGDEPTLDEVQQVLGECTRCRLSEGRSRIVFGDGDPQADLMFIGEGPGAEEDRKGIPFVGRAGELLTQMIEKGLGISRSSVYICNIVKCRPPQNRTPLADEAATCRPFLDGQIESVRPRVIVALGKPAASLLFGRDVAITRVRGTWHEYGGIPVMPTFHPAFVLRQYTPENRRLVWDDLKAALERTRKS